MSKITGQYWCKKLFNWITLIRELVFSFSKRPQILILCGNPADRPALIDFGYSLAKKIGLVICAQVQYVSHYPESWKWVIINAEVHQKKF